MKFVQDLYRIRYFYILTDTMHPLQKKILEIAKLNDLRKYTYRELAAAIDCSYASQAKHHLDQLKKKNLIHIQQNGKLTVSATTITQNFHLPILGQADCGEATRYASDHIEGYLHLSPSLLPKAPLNVLYVLQAKGNSMNQANIAGNTIEDGDYVVVEKREAYLPKNNDIIVSVINGMANIKCFREDPINQRVILLSRSTEPYPPIVIANEDLEQYRPAGKVAAVIKGLDNTITLEDD